MKRAVMILGILLLAGLLTACGSQGAANEDSAEAGGMERQIKLITEMGSTIAAVSVEARSAEPAPAAAPQPVQAAVTDTPSAAPVETTEPAPDQPTASTPAPAQGAPLAAAPTEEEAPAAVPQEAPPAIAAPEETPPAAIADELRNMRISAGGHHFAVTLYDNEATQALRERLPLSLQMSELNGNEKYHYLQEALPTNAAQPAGIQAGDLMLYGSDCLVLFYQDFTTTYSYTPLGRIENVDGLQEALGDGAVEVTFALE